MDIMSLQTQGLLVTQGQIPMDIFMDLIEEYEDQLFEEGYYKNGPTMAEFRLSDFKEDEQLVTIYIPVNAEVEGNEQAKWLDSFSIKKALRERTPFDGHAGKAIEDMKTYLEQGRLEYEDRIILILIRVFEEYWVDLIIPLKES